MAGLDFKAILCSDPRGSLRDISTLSQDLDAVTAEAEHNEGLRLVQDCLSPQV